MVTIQGFHLKKGGPLPANFIEAVGEENIRLKISQKHNIQPANGEKIAEPVVANVEPIAEVKKTTKATKKPKKK